MSEKNGPVWCEENQIYIGGVPENVEVKDLIRENDGHLKVFGYGSLCWNPGTDGGLSKASHTLGKVNGYKRVWAQRSTDHRGNIDFPGIVCTLLTKDEYESVINAKSNELNEDFVTKGVIFDVPPELVDETLRELDFREKGGYARDVCQVIEDGSEQKHKALLYRGTPDNPAFSSRILLDLPLAGAIMSVSIGPSGANDVYLNNLDKFLVNTKNVVDETIKDDTKTLAAMVRSYQNHYKLYFLSGGGSNQHNQLFLNRPNIVSLVQADDAHVRKDIVLPTPTVRTMKDLSNDPIAIYAGGGHSGLLTSNGQLLLWGWNDNLQCGTITTKRSTTEGSVSVEKQQPLPFIEQLENVDVEKAALGFSHTLVIEKETGKLISFGNDERGQVSGRRQVPLNDISVPPMTPEFLINEKIELVSAGVFHSAVVTRGELITFGCNRFGQTNLPRSSEQAEDHSYRRWKPDDAGRILDVACGRRHTIAVDSLNRIWTFGENKYGQLGRRTNGKTDSNPSIVDMKGNIGKDDVVSVYCGWSHTVIHIKGRKRHRLFGFGRNDKGQLGIGSNLQVNLPVEIFSEKEMIKSVRCGSESTMIVDAEDQIWGCGWNEHGNIGTGDQQDALNISFTQGVKSCKPPGMKKNTEIALAVGGAHYLVATVET